ncbi:MAG: M48 family metallopeptidase [Gammaproteobacteria bacterium]|nr:M48 family metallopeptidase [Gammaproteobacteria bacterium]
MRVAARYFDGRSAAAIPVELALAPDGTVCLTGPVGVRSYRLADIRVSTRLGSVPRELRLPDGGLCEVTDHAALDSLLAAARYRDPADWVHRLEQHWGWALTAVVAVAAILAFAVLVGIPTLARTAAATIPPELDRVLGEQALAALDQMLLRPTTVSPEGKAELRALLAGVAADAPGEWSFRLELRSSHELGANALALPSGIVVVTDQLLEAADNDDQLRAVMAHEVGHVVYRHSLRMILQQSGTALFSLVLLGDASSLSSAVAGLPVMAVTARHSREFEAEADDYALAWMDRHQIPREAWADMLRNLEAAVNTEGWQPGFLASHPRTEDRIGKAGELRR